MLYLFFIEDQQAGPIEAIQQSVRAMLRNFWPCLAVLITTSVGSFLMILLTCGLGSLVVIPLGIPFMALIFSSFYLQAIGEVGGQPSRQKKA